MSKNFQGTHLRILPNSMLRWGIFESNPKVFAKKEHNHDICLLYLNSMYQHQPNVPPQKLCASQHAGRAGKIKGPGTLILAYKRFVHCWEHGGSEFRRFQVLFFATTMFLRASGPPRFTSGPHLRPSFLPQGLTCPKTPDNFRPRASEVSPRP